MVGVYEIFCQGARFLCHTRYEYTDDPDTTTEPQVNHVRQHGFNSPLRPLTAHTQHDRFDTQNHVRLQQYDHHTTRPPAIVPTLSTVVQQRSRETKLKVGNFVKMLKCLRLCMYFHHKPALEYGKPSHEDYSMYQGTSAPVVFGHACIAHTQRNDEAFLFPHATRT